MSPRVPQDDYRRMAASLPALPREPSRPAGERFWAPTAGRNIAALAVLAAFFLGLAAVVARDARLSYAQAWGRIGWVLAGIGLSGLIGLCWDGRPAVRKARAKLR